MGWVEKNSRRGRMEKMGRMGTKGTEGQYQKDGRERWKRMVELKDGRER